jgi:hypothetical protein
VHHLLKRNQIRSEPSSAAAVLLFAFHENNAEPWRPSRASAADLP